MNIRSSETQITGHWHEEGGGVHGDAACERIHWLTRKHLEKIATTDGGWTTLYRDPGDGRLWERTFPHGDWHGGGPPALRVISEVEAHEKYGIAPAHS